MVYQSFRVRLVKSVLLLELFRLEVHGGLDFVEGETVAARNFADLVELGSIADVDQHDGVLLQKLAQSLAKI